MLQIIPLLKSGTLRGLLVALIAYMISLSGAAEQFPDAEGYLDVALKALEAFGILYAGWARAFQPTPPLTSTAEVKTADMVSSGDLKVTK